ncbi:primosomal protein N' [Buchnera aphidicola (Melanaphis sacchari)]|uniref:Replication restart protein PriA n=1 Tax=Buchnera aphidicola (Melanaphis sacchari) TaxID=2173854 RepID=A0A2U8DGR3_9GAMM|nr:primosomal protein N' [Buchnera aphidicola]AWH90645.1 primosomal protein N' [Buchnera aphidicola (Melanaphis sacchari)]
MIILDVILPIPIRKSFKYFMPDAMQPVIGGRVIVPFRSKNRMGIIISYSNIKNIDNLNFKFIKQSIDNQSFYSKSLLYILTWLDKIYFCPIGIIFFEVLPRYLTKDYIIPKEDYEIFFKREKIYIKKIFKKCLNKLHKKNSYKENIFNIKYKLKVKKNIFLNKKIIFQINSILKKNYFSSYLVTKTNLFLRVKFYLGLIKKVLNKNLQILILTPVIKDVFRILFFLKKYFNVHIDVIHSEINEKDYLIKWIRTKNGKNSIVIGTNKSVFFPFLNLGLIIVTEEHHPIYKNLNQCRYHVRNLGILRSYKEKIPIILDSKTPSLKILHRVIHKKCTFISFNQKNYCSLILKKNIIDLKKEQIKSGLSLSFICKVFKTLKRNYPVLLIFHKLDFIFFGLICRYCKWAFKCNICDDIFEMKKNSNILFCRHCLINVKKPLFCQNCKNLSLIIFKFGIKRVKENIKKIFPKIPLFFLLNKNSKLTKKSYVNFFTIPISNACIIITTTKVAQNYYFPYVKLIGFTNIDYYLFSFNFYAIDYFAQFYFNLTNLVSKNSEKLKILIQTSSFDNPFLSELLKNEYFYFARRRLLLRKQFSLPPWNYQIIIYSKSKKINLDLIFLKVIQKILKNKFKKHNTSLWFIGPHPTFFKRNSIKFSYQLLIQCSSCIFLKNMLRQAIGIIECFSVFQNVQWFIDFDIN